jgi:hypothetical protein
MFSTEVSALTVSKKLTEKWRRKAPYFHRFPSSYLAPAKQLETHGNTLKRRAVENTKGVEYDW